MVDFPSRSAMGDETRRFLTAGYSNDQLMAYFERSNGEFILLQPRAEGLNWLVWLGPRAALLIGSASVAHRVGYLGRPPRRSEKDR